MLTRSSEVAPQDKYYSDSLLTVPTESESIYHNLSAGFATPNVAVDAVDSTMSGKPQGEAVSSILGAVELENETPGTGSFQHYSSMIANMVGQSLNPMTWFIAPSAGLVTRGITSAAAKVAPDAATMFMRKPLKDLVSEPISKYVPGTIGKELEKEALTVGLIGEKAINTFGTFAGYGVPQGIVDNYRQDTNHIEWGGVAREAGEMGAFGLAIGSIPFTYGILRGKINRGLDRDIDSVIDHNTLDAALKNGTITKEEHKWYNDYLDHRANPKDEVKAQELKEIGTKIINQNDQKANTVTNEALFHILKPEDMQNLQGAAADQLVGGIPEPYNTALSDFIVHKTMDEHAANPKGLDGVRGYVDFINEKLKTKPEKIAEADSILEKHLMKGARENMPFSQKELMKNIKKVSFESSHIKQLPITIPENISQHIKSLNKMSYLINKNKKLIRQGKPENKQTLNRISEIEKSLPKILTPKEELLHIKEQLLRPEGLPKNWEMSNVYHRLVDLSHVWHNARTLLDRIHLENEYNRQEAFRDLASQTLRIADSNATRIASPDNVVDYLRRRIEGNINKVEPIKEVKQTLDESQKVPVDSDEILNEQSSMIEKSTAEDAKTEFNQATDKYTEFKNSFSSIFKNYISCVLGGING